MGTRDGYRWNVPVGLDAPVSVSYRSPPWFGHRPRLKVSRPSLGSRFEPLSPRPLSEFYFVRDPLLRRWRPFRIVRVVPSAGVRTFPSVRFQNQVRNQSFRRDGHSRRVPFESLRPKRLSGIGFVSLTRRVSARSSFKYSRLGLGISVPNRARAWVRVSINPESCVQCTALAGLCVLVVREDLSHFEISDF
ncbi:hypothetical protein AVEN_58500-1 [Araneus ventricosus]|uniref:Uncharacterized protein n=1 Tax=Araneus ventricosus TaxID=182803 RepID=A0A4Y2IAC9_ARAVE|nr:hypothetical protein AVEN_58500-1 [Araneus ventricosus]